MKTEAEWISSDPILLNGEIVVTSDKKGMTKTGDGSSKWSELTYNAAGTLYGLSASVAELNYVKGVTSNIQTQINNKAPLSHTHNYLPLSGGTMTGNISYNLYSSTQTPLKIYGGNADGQGISVGAGGATIVGAGESAKACEELLSATNEELWLTSDNGIKFYVACQPIANRLLVTLDSTRQFYPATTNNGSIGTSSHKWASVYATNLYGALDGTIKSTAAAPTADTTYYIDMHAGNSTAQKTLYHNGYFRHNFRKGAAQVTDEEGTVTTAAVTGYNRLILGSNINAGTDNNAYGALRLYSTNTGYAELRYNASSGNVTHYLPTTGGTLAVFNAARVSGRVVITDGTSGNIKSSGYTIETSVPSNAVFTDKKVTQTAITTSDYANYRPLLFGFSNSSTAGFTPATVTEQIYASNNMYVQPSTGTITANVFKGNLTGNVSGNVTGNSDTATKLAVSRTVRTNLASTAAASFNGSANITPGVTGILPVANGGTGSSAAGVATNNLYAQSLAPGVSIASDSDLDDYTASGSYFVPNASTAATIAHAPLTSSGYMLSVYKTYGSASTSLYRLQIAMTYYGATYTRYRNAEGSWSAWTQRKYTDNNTTYSAATASAAGLMSAADKAKLDNITAILCSGTEPTGVSGGTVWIED
ncbi:MAG: pyocin knob domain-containing protein [Eubacteriales bacterium]|nr:pyocin knob domain-containing protein [Eubacteriales bacterium]